MKRKIKIIAVLSFLIVLCAVRAVQAQQSLTEGDVVKADGNAGELNSARLDFLAVEQEKTNERIFVIARLGRGETARSLNLQRLQAARSYLVEIRGVKSEQIVFAEGEKVAVEGRIEFCVGGKLSLVSLAAHGKNVSLVCGVD